MQRLILCFLCVSGTLAAEEPLPSDVQRVLDDHAQAVKVIQSKAEQKIRSQNKKTIAALRELQDRYTRDAKLDEAVAIRDRIRCLVESDGNESVQVLPAPDRLYDYRDFLNRPLYFQVTGQVNGTVWGTDIYTGDSPLAAAAVHAGAVELGETRVVKVTMLPGQASYTASTRHGITTNSYHSYSFSYRVERTHHPVRERLTVPAIAPQQFLSAPRAFGTRRLGSFRSGDSQIDLLRD